MIIRNSTLEALRDSWASIAFGLDVLRLGLKHALLATPDTNRKILLSGWVYRAEHAYQCACARFNEVLMATEESAAISEGLWLLAEDFSRHSKEFSDDEPFLRIAGDVAS